MLNLFFVALGVLIIVDGKDVMMGWICTGIFALGIPIFVKQIVDNRPRIILKKTGIEDRLLGVGEIAWKDIQALRVRSLHSNDYICLEINQHDLAKYLDQLSPLKRKLIATNKTFDFEDLNINLSGVKVSTDDFVNVMLEMIEESKQSIF